MQKELNIEARIEAAYNELRALAKSLNRENAVRALDKAIKMLQHGKRIIRRANGALAVESASTKGLFYTLVKQNGKWTSNTPAAAKGNVSWHVALASIYERAGII